MLTLECLPTASEDMERILDPPSTQEGSTLDGTESDCEVEDMEWHTAVVSALVKSEASRTVYRDVGLSQPMAPQGVAEVQANHGPLVMAPQSWADSFFDLERAGREGCDVSGLDNGACRKQQSCPVQISELANRSPTVLTCSHDLFHFGTRNTKIYSRRDVTRIPNLWALLHQLPPGCA